jgi:ferredoxin
MGFNFQESVTPRIDTARCGACGRCVAVCASETLKMVDGRVDVARRHFMGCIGCGQCMAACPTGAIEVQGRRFAPADLVPLPPAALPTPDQFDALLLARRSVRRFTAEEIERAVVERILAMAATAPVGIPPTEVRVLVFHGRERVRALAAAAIPIFERLATRFTPLKLALLRPFLGKATATLIRDFVRPLYTQIAADWRAGRDTFTYDAPLALLFHSPASSDAADEHIAATYAMLAAHSLGLGTCLLGTPAGLNFDPPFKAKYGIPAANKIGLGLVAGYPAVRFTRGIRRQWADLRFV